MREQGGAGVASESISEFSSYRRHVYYREVIKWPGARPAKPHTRLCHSPSVLYPHGTATPGQPHDSHSWLSCPRREARGASSYGTAFIRVICHP